MIVNESTKTIDPTVAAPLPPVAICDKGVWSIVTNGEELARAYESQFFIKIKETWKDTKKAKEFIDQRALKLKIAGMEDVVERLTFGLESN